MLLQQQRGNARTSLSRSALLLSAALVALVAPQNAWADGNGGKGGDAAFGAGGGAGGTGFAGAAGSTGSGGGAGVGAGGGGGSAGGGAGGVGGGSAHAAGGTGGTAGTPNGGNGADGAAPSLGGGGGGGGANGNGAGTANLLNTTTLQGGNGGKGGNGGTDGGGNGSAGGGGGGGGGFGAIVTGAGASSNSAAGVIQGGTGGQGGIAGGANSGVASAGGSGGAGGVGILFTTAAASFTNLGGITGGNGGAGGAGVGGGATGLAGAGGAGVSGAGLTVINGGTITGGLSGDNAIRASAVIFTGGTNTLEIDSGSTLVGNAVAFSTADTLAFGGTTNFSFDGSLIGSAAQYQGFGILSKTGSNTVSLLTAATTATPWTITSGILSLTHVTAGAIDAAGTGTIKLGGGTLETTVTGTLSNALTATPTSSSHITAVAGQTLTLAPSFLNLAAGSLTLGFGSVTDTGTVILAPAGGTNGLNNALAVNGGTLTLGNLAAAGTLNNMQAGVFVGTAAATATLDLGGNSLTVTNLAGNTNGVITDNGANTTLSVKSTADTTFAGVIQDGTGRLGLATTSGSTQTLTLTGVQTYAGGTDIAAGSRLALSGSGSIATSAGMSDSGTFDISGTSAGATIHDLSSGGAVSLGSQTLTISNGPGVTFSGVIADGGIVSGTGGNVTVSGGSQVFSGVNTYTGVTTLTGGTLALSGSGSIAASSNVVNNGNFDISATTGGATITSMFGTGTVALGNKTLTLSAGSGNIKGVISDTGGGAIALTGGTQILSATNTYAGGTFINGGTLIDAKTGALGGGTVSMADGSTLGFGANALTVANIFHIAGTAAISPSGGQTETISGVIADTTTGGALSKTGAGTLILTGINTYSGITSIATGGTLALSGVGSIASSSGVTDTGTLDVSGITAASTSFKALSGAGTVALGGKTLSLNGIASFAGVIQDGGLNGGIGAKLVVAGGAETLSGVNTYSGGTTLSGGAVLAANAAALGTGAVTFAGGTLKAGAAVTLANTASIGAGQIAILDQNGFALGYAGAITGGGGVTVANSGVGGKVSLSNAGNAWTGATLINSGATLALIDTSSLAASSGLADAGTFDISGVTASASLAALSGAGSVVLGAHTLTLTGVSNFSGIISGTGGLTLTGSGTTILDGASSYTGTTTLTAGTLEVGDVNSPNAALAGPVSVGSGATLMGHGTINGGVTMASGGTLRPGGTIGTLNVNGNVSIPAGSTFAAEFSNTAASQLKASGTVTLGGALQLVSDSTTYVSGTDYKLISAGNVAGTFSAVNGAVSGYTNTVQYSATGVDLILTAPVVVTPPVVTPPVVTPPVVTPPVVVPPVITTFLFASYVTAPNQVAVGNAVTAASPTAPLYVALGNLVTANKAALPATLGQLSGDIHAGLRSAAIEDSRIIRDTVLDHLNGAGEGTVIWGAGFGGYGSMAAGRASGLHHDSAGVIAGADFDAGNGLRLGLAAAYAGNNASTTGKASTASGNSGHVIAYGGWSNGQIDLKAGGDFGWGSNQVSRSITTLSQIDIDHQSAQGQQLFAEGGYRISTELAMVEPYLGLASITAQTGSFAENGGNSALSGGSKSDSQTYSTLGLRAAFAPLTDLGGLAPHIDLGWQHGFSSLKSGQVLTFQSLNQNFTALDPALSPDAAATRFGFDFVIAAGATLSLDYDGSFSSKVQNNAIRGGLAWRF